MKKFAILFLVLFSLQACTESLRKFAYNNLLVQLVMSRVDNVFNLNDKQESFLKKRLKIHHSWHRKTQLKLYTKDLNAFKARLERGLQKNDLNWLSRRVRRHAKVVYRRLIPDSSKFLVSLSPDQVKHMNEAWAERNEEIAAKLRRPKSVRHAETLEKIIDNIEDFTGDLSAAQKQMIKAEYKKMPDSGSMWMSYRRESLKRFTAFLNSKPSEKEIKAELTRRWLNFENNLPKKYKRSFNTYVTRINAMILKIDQSLTPVQRINAVKKTEEYIRMSRDLSQGV